MTKDELAPILSAVQEDMTRVDELMQDKLQSSVPTINDLGSYIIESGGKRLRPVMVLLAARACGYTGSDHIKMAVIIEFVHTATLLHDDVVDESMMRRGRETANARWGNNLSVLVGDFLYSRAFEMMVEVGHMRVMQLLAQATNVISEGEVRQALNRGNADLTETDYLEVIASKTARLFAAAAELGAVAAQLDDQQRQQLSDYGNNIGIAYQLLDDVLDYQGEAKVIGKNIGDDLAEGQPTLPLIRAMQSSSDQKRELLRSAIETPGSVPLDKVVDVIESSDAIAYTARRAKEHAELAKLALGDLPDSNAKTAMLQLTDFAISRAF